MCSRQAGPHFRIFEKTLLWPIATSSALQNDLGHEPAMALSSQAAGEY